MRGVLGGRLLVVLVLVRSSLGTVYTVGGSSGWTIGVDYSTWVASNTFLVGDTLVFNYASGHTVDQVSKKDYTTCTTGNAITTDSSGTTTVPLKAPGPLYFICGITGHCGSGMKLALTVSSASSATPPVTTYPPTINSTGAVPCTNGGATPNVYGTAGGAPFLMSGSPMSLSPLPAALLAAAGGILAFTSTA